MTESSANSNESATGATGSDPWDVLVIGGGIVGAGVARDAALRGLRTMLVDQGDFASGTSSRSSRLLHGGIRYLAQGRIGLVREANHEKGVLSHIAPHLCQPLPFIFPTRRNTSWPRWKLSLGVRLYDWLCGRKKLGRSSTLSVEQTLELLPGLAKSELTGAVRYFDALTNDSRLVIDTLRSAANAGATAMNYVKFTSAKKGEHHWNCQLHELRSKRDVEVAARTVVNATGPWSDKLPHSGTSLRLTKGVHLVVDRKQLDVPEAVVLTEGDRVLFVIPWGERMILGTTDTDYDGPLSQVVCDSEDVRYVLGVVNEAFPGARLQPSDVLSTWAGLRPLVADKNGNPSDISRRHEVFMNEPGWWDVTGGKLTTYRLMAEEAVDLIVDYLGVSVDACQTATKPLLADGDTRGSGVLPPPVSEAAVSYYCRHEWAYHLDDIMIRRTSWSHSEDNPDRVAEQVSEWMAAEFNWNEDRLRRERDEYEALVADPIDVPAPHFVNFSTSEDDGTVEQRVRGGGQNCEQTLS